MRHALLAGIAAIAAIAFVPSANATLQLSIGANGSTFTCADGQLGCDLSGGANNLLTVNTLVGGAFVQITLTQSTAGATNSLQLSSSNIENQSGAPLTVTLLASQTDFIGPVTSVNNSGSLTFNDNVGAPDSTLKFWADAANTQGANPTNTPGTLLESVSGAATTNPDSFSGSNVAAFVDGDSFSMTEGAALALITGGSVTGFNQSMVTSAGTIPVPEPMTLGILGMGLLGLGMVRYRRGTE
jgi:hypothetical protein